MKKIISCATSCYGYQIDLDVTLRDIASLGFSGVEFMSIPGWFEHLLPESSVADRQQLVSLLSSLHLCMPAMSAHCQLGNPNGLEQLLARIDLAASFGIKLVLTGAGNLEGSEEIKIFHSSIEKVLPYAAEKGITLLLETGGTYLSTGEKTCRFISSMASPFLQIAYDPANVALWGKADPVHDLPKCVEAIKHFHIKEYKAGQNWHPPLGDGQIDFNSLFALLEKVHYPGDFSIEIDLKEQRFALAHANLKRSLEFLHHETNFDTYFGSSGEKVRSENF